MTKTRYIESFTGKVRAEGLNNHYSLGQLLKSPGVTAVAMHSEEEEDR
jgi:hypothetical protein